MAPRDASDLNDGVERSCRRLKRLTSIVDDISDSLDEDDAIPIEVDREDEDSLVTEIQTVRARATVQRVTAVSLKK